VDKDSLLLLLATLDNGLGLPSKGSLNLGLGRCDTPLSDLVKVIQLSEPRLELVDTALVNNHVVRLSLVERVVARVDFHVVTWLRARDSHNLDTVAHDLAICEILRVDALLHHGRASRTTTGHRHPFYTRASESRAAATAVHHHALHPARLSQV
jgi:hypothetical protein